MNKPQPKVKIKIIQVIPDGGIEFHTADEEASNFLLEELKEFGNLYGHRTREVCLFVNSCYDFSEVLRYIEYKVQEYENKNKL